MDISLPPSRWSGLLCCVAALFTWVSPSTARAEEDFKWQPLRIGGRDYFSAEQIGHFYKLKVSRSDGNKIVLDDGKKVRISMEVGSPLCEMNGIRFVFGAPVTEANDQAQISRSDLTQILEPVLRPEFVKAGGRLEIVILDPDHGGDDRADAADHTLQIAKLAAKELEITGCKAVLTRDDGVAMTPEKRLELANAVQGKAVFIRIHFGSGENEKRGIGTAPLVPRNDDPTGAELPQGNLGPASIALAAAVHGSLAPMFDKHMVDLGIQRASDPVFSKLRHPAISLNVGLSADPEDEELIRHEPYRKALAKAICSGVRRFGFATKQ